MKTCKPVSRILAVVLAFACIAAAADNPTPNKHKFCTFECPGAGKGSGQGTGALGINLAGTIVGSCLGGNKLRSLSRVPPLAATNFGPCRAYRWPAECGGSLSLAVPFFRS
jgi:hypothetical protein